MGGLLAHSKAAETVTDPARGFTLELPAGFASEPGYAESSPKIAHSFVLGDRTDEQPDIVLLVEDMGGVIPQDGWRQSEDDLPPGMSLLSTQWQDHELDAVEIAEHIHGIDFVTINVQIPLKRGAVQLKLAAPAERKQELHRLLHEVVAGLKGESNWDASQANDKKLVLPEWMRTKSFRTVLIGVAIAILVVGLVVYWIVSRYGPAWAVLAVAGSIFVVGWSLDKSPFPEFLVLVGAVKLLGFVGLILGFIDLVRPRKGARHPAGQFDSTDETRP